MNLRLMLLLTCFVVCCACVSSVAPARENAPRKISRATLPDIEPDEPTIRVRVARNEQEITLESKSGMDLASNGTKRYAAKSLTVSISRGAITAVIGSESIAVAKEGVTVRPARGGIISLGGVPLGGELRVVPAKGGKGIDVIEHIGLETYLPSVLAKELYPGWEAEAYRAQAIAARSYALHESARQRALGSAYDVESTVQDQAYGGANAHDRARRAGVATRGVVMQYAGDVLRAYYSSTCGGRSASARDVWPIHEGYRFNLASPIQTSPRQNACSASPRFTWRAQRDRDTLSARLRAFAAANGLPFSKMKRFASVRVIERNAHARPTLYELRDSAGGRWDVKPEDLRNACNFADGKRLAKVNKAQFVYSGDLGFTVRGSGVTIKGRGFGHGVGMCQFGAQGLAKKGWQAEQILRHYYPGAEIVQGYE